jgi:hypothetical protein
MPAFTLSRRRASAVSDMFGDVGQVQRHPTLARENSTTRQDRELYAAKLQRIKTGVH